MAALVSAAASLILLCKRGVTRKPIEFPEVSIQQLDFQAGDSGPHKAVVLAPKWGAPGERFPLLVALHGRGESHRGLEAGAWGWTTDYQLERAMVRLRKPPLDLNDLHGVSSAAHVSELNSALRAHPFRGLVVACPYTPDLLSDPSLDAAEPFAQFLEQHLIPTVRARFPVIASASATGIDGVSLGGRVALLVGSSRPQVFGAVGSMQAAVRPREVAAMASRLAQKRDQPIRILTSEKDPFRQPLAELVQALQAASRPVEFKVVPGPHDYEFNRGPGAFEMLLWHDRMLRR